MLTDHLIHATVFRPYNNLYPEVNIVTYNEAKKYLLEQLRRDIESHSLGEFKKVGEGFEHVDQNLPRNSGPEFNKLFLALNFWDSWQDARNHEWHYYKGISQADWPQLAKIIIKDIEEDKEITSRVILDHFDFKPSFGIIKRITSFFEKKSKS
jgi:hypothetical protein